MNNLSNDPNIDQSIANDPSTVASHVVSRPFGNPAAFHSFDKCHCAQVGNYSFYAFHTFSFGPAVSLAQNTTYFVSLSSPAADTQSLAYFITNDVYFISDAAGVEVVPSPAAFNVIVTPPPPPPGIPEPQTLVMMATGVALIFARGWALSKAAKKKEL